MQLITVTVSQTKRCRGTLQCQQVCNWIIRCWI